MPAKISLIGRTFGKLKVLSEVPERRIISGMPRLYYLCLCECGQQKEIISANLRTGNARSCGCLIVETLRKNFTKHGHATKGGLTRTYNSWVKMKSRCYDTKGNQYKDYGGRGIKVCEEWKTFSNFLSDMGERPPNTSIDRKDNNGNYEPSNCKWATSKEQRRNTRTSHFVSVDGFTGNFVDAAAHFKIPHGTAHSRRRYGWTDEDIFLTPVDHRKRPLGKVIHS